MFPCSRAAANYENVKTSGVERALRHRNALTVDAQSSFLSSGSSSSDSTSSDRSPADWLSSWVPAAVGLLPQPLTRMCLCSFN